MVSLWNTIDKNEWNIKMKQCIYLWAVTIILAIIGAIVWLGSSMAVPTLNHGNMLFCFAGYPAVCGWICAVIHLMRTGK